VFNGDYLTCTVKPVCDGILSDLNNFLLSDRRLLLNKI
jgi:hypothetical protein